MEMPGVDRMLPSRSSSNVIKVQAAHRPEILFLWTRKTKTRANAW